MEHESLSSASALSPAACRLLAKRSSLDLLDVIGTSELSANEVAEALGEDISKVWYKLRQLTKAGLLSDAQVRPRKGRAEKLYRAASERFFITAEKRTSTVGRHLSAYLSDRLEQDPDIKGEIFYHDGQRWRVQKVFYEDSFNATSHKEMWLMTVLTSEDRQRFCKEMDALFEKYRTGVEQKGARYLVHFAYAPYKEDL